MKYNTLQDLFIDELEDLYDAERQIIDALPKMEQAASSPELKKAFRTHLQQTTDQLHRLDEVFNRLGVSHDGKSCEGMKGIIHEGEELLGIQGDPAVKDAALIAAAQRVEHYEIAGYGTARTYAHELGYNDVEDTLPLKHPEDIELDGSKCFKCALSSISTEVTHTLFEKFQSPEKRRKLYEEKLLPPLKRQIDRGILELVQHCKSLTTASFDEFTQGLKDAYIALQNHVLMQQSQNRTLFEEQEKSARPRIDAITRLVSSFETVQKMLA